MSTHTVDSSNVKAGVFDDSVLPGIFAQINAAEKADKELTAALEEGLEDLMQVIPNVASRRGFFIDIIYNQTDDFTASDVQATIETNYSLYVNAAARREMEAVIEELSEMELIESSDVVVDTTRDMFEGVTV